jgi:hypothetical protein
MDAVEELLLVLTATVLAVAVVFFISMSLHCRKKNKNTPHNGQKT